MPDPTARMTRKPRVSALAIAALVAAVAVACVAVYFFAMESKEWIPFAGLMCFAVALLIYGVVELAAHSRDARRWRDYEVAYDEVTDPAGSWWGDDSGDDGDDNERLSTYPLGGDDENAGAEEEDEPEEPAVEVEDRDRKDTSPVAAESYTPLDVLVAKRASKGNAETPSTRDTMPGAGKNSIPPVGGSGSMPTPGAVTIPHVDESASDDSAEVETAKEVDVDTSVDSDSAAAAAAESGAEDTEEDTATAGAADKDEPTEDTETRVDTAADKEEDTAAERLKKSVLAVDFMSGEFTFADNPDEDDKESTAAAEDTETRVDNPAVEDKESTADNTETRVDNPAVTAKDEDTKTATAKKSNHGGFNLLGFGKQDKE